MIMERMDVDRGTPLGPVMLEEGHAEVMGDGMFLVCQEAEGVTHRVALSLKDLETMLRA